ncbi:MAG: type I methionyl aminopeptidase [Candidatus Berkelbacteria bacterium]|nr:type I methionyl aminopeptidase [Candidatus Berkelbacteria bacterium]
MQRKLLPEQLADFRKSGQILATALAEVVVYVKPGITTANLDDIAERSLRRQGAQPSFKNYKTGDTPRFPASLCVSINDELVHGIPSEKRFLKNGDIISLDLGANYYGTFTDMAVTVAVGKITAEEKKIIDVTKNVLDTAIKFVKPGITTGDLGSMIDEYVKKNNLLVIRDFVGHGIGLMPHDEPQVPNFGQPGKGTILEEGMAIAIEPMLTTRDIDVKIAKDGWTVRMAHGQHCAHFEHTILITKTGAEIITKL